MHNGKHTLTLQEDGAIRAWQLDQAELDREAELWKQMYGSVDEFTVTVGLELKLDGSRVGGPSTPKTGLTLQSTARTTRTTTLTWEEIPGQVELEDPTQQGWVAVAGHTA